MEIIGRANWWMPRWLDRTVPTLGVEVDGAAPIPALAGLEPAGASEQAHNVTVYEIGRGCD